DGQDPYGASYAGSGLERFYSLDGTPVLDGRVETVALDHLAYFPGLPVLGAVSAALPGPLGDVRVLMLLFALALVPAALLLPGPLELRLAAGALLAANPLMVRSTWFGILDAPVVLALVLALALALRGRWGWTGALVALALAQKQYALAAVPFLALAAWQAGGAAALRRAAVAFGAVLAVVLVPFIAWGPAAFVEDTVTYGTSAYRIVGYGLSGILVDLGLVERDGAYPFALIALVTWLPATLVLLARQRRDPAPWRAALGFALSFLVLAWVARTAIAAPSSAACASPVSVSGSEASQRWSGPLVAWPWRARRNSVVMRPPGSRGAGRGRSARPRAGRPAGRRARTSGSSAPPRRGRGARPAR
ncbi:MAG: hypothetical protein ACKOSO_04970, partial [Actinomycetota bacterium]